MSVIKKLASDTAWYGLSSMVGRTIQYLLVPLYTKIFLPGEYGIVTELYAYVAFLFPIFMLGMETAYFRYATEDRQQEPFYFNRIWSLLLVASLGFGGLIATFGSNLAELLGYPGKASLIHGLAGILVVDTLTALPLARLRIQGKAKRFAFIRLANVLLTVLLNLFFLVCCTQVYQGEVLPALQPTMMKYFDFDFKVKYVFLSNLIANTCMLVLLFTAFSGFRFRWSLSHLKPVLSYAFPLLIVGLAGVTNEALSRALLKYWLSEGYYPGQSSLDALGIFGACYKLSIFMLLGTQAFRYAAEPFFFSQAKNQKSPQLFARIMTGFVLCNALIFVAVSLNLDLIGQIFLTRAVYREGLFVVPFLLMGYLFSGINYNLSVWYKVTDRTTMGAWVTLMGALLTVALNFVLIPHLGYLGSALATLGVFFSMALTNYLLGQKYYPVPYRAAKDLAYLLFAALWVYLFYQWNTAHALVNFLVKNLGVLLFALIVYGLERKRSR